MDKENGGPRIRNLEVYCSVADGETIPAAIIPKRDGNCNFCTWFEKDGVTACARVSFGDFEEYPPEVIRDALFQGLRAAVESALGKGGESRVADGADGCVVHPQKGV